MINKMIELQNNLNNATNGNKWKDGLTSENRKINWYRCIYMEAMEAIDSLNWKHWKDINLADDLDNLIVEVVDIWHFILSEAIKHENFRPLYALSVINKSENFKIDKTMVLYKLELIALASLSNSVEITGNELYESDFNIISQDDSYNNLYAIIEEFGALMVYLNLSTEELYKRYIVKNVLNKFRQDHGYKNGTYIKEWNGVEDNVIAFSILEDNVYIDPEELYIELQKRYSKLTLK
jgi:dimeric dUTPase (all-alpha-NTP-PPase superfamily)